MQGSLYIRRNSLAVGGLIRGSRSRGGATTQLRTSRRTHRPPLGTSVALRLITSRAARQLLGLPVEPHHSFTVVELRDSYFRAAKRCHPDVVVQSSSSGESTSHDFILLTQAYDLLQQEASSADATNFVSTPSEEEDFRVACEQHLGLSAEIVEECKQNPGFLRWLSGRTDSAHHWRGFFSQHGGLGPRLKPQQHLPSGGGGSSDNEAGGGRGVNRRVRLVRR